MKCKYDGKDTSICLNCPFADCIRDDIDDDPNIKERYEKARTKRERYRESYAKSDERWQWSWMKKGSSIKQAGHYAPHQWGIVLNRGGAYRHLPRRCIRPRMEL